MHIQSPHAQHTRVHILSIRPVVLFAHILLYITFTLSPPSSPGQIYTGINVKKGKVTDIREENVLQPLLVTVSALK